MNIQEAKVRLKWLDVFFAVFFLSSIAIFFTEGWPPWRVGLIGLWVFANLAYAFVLAKLAELLGKGGGTWFAVAVFVPLGTLIGYNSIGGAARAAVKLQA